MRHIEQGTPFLDEVISGSQGPTYPRYVDSDRATWLELEPGKVYFGETAEEIAELGCEPWSLGEATRAFGLTLEV